MFRWRVVLALVFLLFGVVVWRTTAQSQTIGFRISARSLIHRVAARYHESHPRVVLVERTHTDPPPHDPMYFVHLTGHFRRGRAVAHELYFSALADRLYIWGVTGYAGQGKHRHSTWMDCQRPCTRWQP